MDPIVPSGMFDIMWGGIGFLTGIRPVILHHLPGDSAIHGGVGIDEATADMVEQFLIKLDPVHFAVGPCHKPVQGHVHERYQVPHDAKLKSNQTLTHFLKLSRFARVIDRSANVPIYRENLSCYGLCFCIIAFTSIGTSIIFLTVVYSSTSCAGVSSEIIKA